MAQAVPTRELAKAGWRMPRLKVPFNPVIAGVTLALTAWLLQAYSAAIVAGRDRLARSIQFAELQREMWLIEYNSSLLRTPRNSRATARAAFHVVTNTHELLALSDLARRGWLSSGGEIRRQADEKKDWARELFEARDFAALAAEVSAVSEIYEARYREHSLGMPAHNDGPAWWQHAFPALFLVGLLLCLKGRRAAARNE